MRRMKIMAGSVLLALLGGSCLFHHGVGSALRAEVPVGTVEVRIAGASRWVPLLGGLRIGAGGDVRTGQGSSVALLRDDGARIELGPSTEVHLDGVTRITMTSGGVLAEVKENPLDVDAAGVSASSRRAIFRVDSGFALRVGSYGGDVTVVQDTNRLVVGDFNQVEIAGGVFPRGTEPLRISSTDRWDQKLLADALTIDGELRKYGRAFRAEFGSQVRDPRFYLAFAPGVSLSAVTSVLRTAGDPADVLFGLLLAKRLGASALGDLIRLRLAGATWGLIAREKRIAAKDFIAIVVAALTPQPQGSPSGGSGGGNGNGNGGGGGPGGGPSPSPTGSPTHRPSPTPSPTPSHTASPSPSPSCSPVDQLLGKCTGAFPG